eukprot:gnl/TRDRNA2_/TRDRNA2_157212_c0_seq1.p1 gnl/TRDRNA2_/TRDRNA2_157212_c0~~gnl/TRDRNA2_/TRDRNA2_157212_c0_seq1.p1  ORF type:complete len:219 (-),score=18.03 gnl/TRDRNA2_/TRDRNA2_157212_c0_seq1:140-796(-)
MGHFAGGLQNETRQQKLRRILLSLDFVSFFLCTLVAWGIPMVWVANAASFSAAAGLSNGAAIRSAFFATSVMGRVIIGPLTDTIPLPRELWMLGAAAAIVLCAAGMLATAGRAMYPLAGITGLGFGFVTTLVPMQCKSFDGEIAGTLYSVSKVGAMLGSSAWTYVAGRFAQQYTLEGQTSCVGEECYRMCWLSMLAVAIPLAALYVPWALRAAAAVRT